MHTVKTFQELIAYMERGPFPKRYRPWIIRHLALARNHECSVTAMDAAYPYAKPPGLSFANRLKQVPLDVLSKDGIVVETADGSYRLNAELSPPQITELSEHCDRWLKARKD